MKAIKINGRHIPESSISMISCRYMGDITRGTLPSIVITLAHGLYGSSEEVEPVEIWNHYESIEDAEAVRDKIVEYLEWEVLEL